MSIISTGQLSKVEWPGTALANDKRGGQATVTAECSSPALISSSYGLLGAVCLGGGCLKLSCAGGGQVGDSTK